MMTDSEKNNIIYEKAQKLCLIISPITRIQSQYLNDWEHRFFVVAAGRRSRKTLIGQYKILHSAIKYNDTKYFLGAPTRIQAKDIFWDRIKKQLNFWDLIKDKSESELIVRLKNGSLISIEGLDVPERIEGQTPSWDGCHITEFPNIKQRAWAENIRPTLSDKNAFAILDGVPDFRHPWYAEMAAYACGGFIPATIPEMGAFGENPNDKSWCYYSWFSSDVLSPSEIEAAKREMDEKVFRQEYEGSFEKAGGLVYYNYTRENYSELKFNPELDTVLCWDFNVNPMSCEVNQLFDKDKWVFNKEFYHHDSNTFATSEAVYNFLTDNNFHGDLYITGDYTGGSRRTSASQTDWQIIMDRFKNFNPTYKIRQTTSVKDRVNCTNAAFKNALGEIKQYVNIKECPNLDKDLCMVTWKENGVELNDEGGKRTHASDAGSYHSYNWYPITTMKAEIY